MRRILKNAKVRAKCHILTMLEKQAKRDAKGRKKRNVNDMM